MVFSGERMAPRGSPKSWAVKKEKKVEEFDMRVRVFTNGATERLDVEIIDGGNKRRLYTHDGPQAEIRGEGFVAGYAVGRTELKKLTPQPHTKPGKKKAKPTITLENATREQLLEGLLAAMRDMGNPHWSEDEQEGTALGYVRNAARAEL